MGCRVAVVPFARMPSLCSPVPPTPPACTTTHVCRHRPQLCTAAPRCACTCAPSWATKSADLPSANRCVPAPFTLPLTLPLPLPLPSFAPPPPPPPTLLPSVQIGTIDFYAIFARVDVNVPEEYAQYLTFFSIMSLPVLFTVAYMSASRMNKDLWRRDFVEFWPRTRRRYKIVFWVLLVALVLGPMFARYPKYECLEAWPPLQLRGFC